MAGRGVDIKLGGDPSGLTKGALQRTLFPWLLRVSHPLSITATGNRCLSPSIVQSSIFSLVSLTVDYQKCLWDMMQNGDQEVRRLPYYRVAIDLDDPGSTVSPWRGHQTKIRKLC